MDGNNHVDVLIKQMAAFSCMFSGHVTVRNASLYCYLCSAVIAINNLMFCNLLDENFFRILGKTDLSVTLKLVDDLGTWDRACLDF